MELSPDEQALAANAGILLTKNRIIQAVYELDGELAEIYRVAVRTLPDELIQMHPKISKGENYLGLPWVMLDYPRNFSNKDTFAIRTLFWWGNHFSMHLLLQGKFMVLLNKQELLETQWGKHWFFCTGDSPWQHHFDEPYMVPVPAVQLQDVEKQGALHGFYKLSVKLPVTAWNEAEAFLTAKFKEALQFIQFSDFFP